MARLPESVEDFFRDTVPTGQMDIVEEALSGQPLYVHPEVLPSGDERVKKNVLGEMCEYQWSADSWMPDKHYHANLWVDKRASGPIQVQRLVQSVIGDINSHGIRVDVNFDMYHQGRREQKHLLQYVSLANIPATLSSTISGVTFRRSISNDRGVVTTATVYFQHQREQEMQERLGVPQRLRTKEFLYYVFLPDGSCVLEDLHRVLVVIPAEKVPLAGLGICMTDTKETATCVMIAGAYSLTLRIGKLLHPQFVERMFSEHPLFITDNRVDVAHISGGIQN